jgi:signal transduction histidine kinase
MSARSALRTLPLRRIGIVALLVAAALLILSAIALNIGLSGLRTSRSTVDRTNIILRGMAELRTTVRTAETGQRGFLLTGQERYLAPYDRAIRQVPAELVTLRRLVRDPGQQALLKRMEPVLDAKLEELARTVALRRTSLDAALRIVRTDLGQRLTEEFEALATRFVDAEQALLAARVAEEERSARLTATAAAVTGLLSLLSALLGAYLLLQQRSADALLRYSHELEHQVEERTAKLRDANKELDAFAYTISHDLRAPLRAMHGYADALVEDHGDALGEEGRHFAVAISAAALRMNALIEDILTYARMAREELSLRTVSLDTVVERARADLLERASAPADIALERPLGSVVAHPAVMMQVIDNLIANAVKFVAVGVEARVQVRSEPAGAMLRLWVEDDGIGIAPDHLARIFEPFERLHGVESYPGTGIGLAIVRRAVERMGGTCGVQSELNLGSRFWIELPRAVEERLR